MENINYVTLVLDDTDYEKFADILTDKLMDKMRVLEEESRQRSNTYDLMRHRCRKCAYYEGEFSLTNICGKHNKSIYDVNMDTCDHALHRTKNNHIDYNDYYEQFRSERK